MPTYKQADRPLSIKTDLGEDTLLLLGIGGEEAISQLFRYQLDLIAENDTEILFDKLLGQKVHVRLMLPNDRERFFSGICSRISQGARDDVFTEYRIEMVPQFWLLTRRKQSRIFQHLSVPDILKEVLKGLDVKFEIQGTFHPRDFCVQYRETDFNFASRLMEEEGIYYFFQHTKDGHTMIVANTPESHPDTPDLEQLLFDEVEGGNRDESDRCHFWEKVQELRPGKYTLWDHSFELPHKHLEAEQPIIDSVTVGEVVHKVKLSVNSALEIYDYPGAYAQRFDGIDKGGDERPADIEKIFEDNKRTVNIRMQQESLPGLIVRGASSSRQLVSGHKFKLDRHFNANGEYLLTQVSHNARLGYDYRSGDQFENFEYENTFSCIPLSVPFRPQCVTPKPSVRGTQTAVVVGPSGEEIFPDKYGRVKVQFHWDRESQADADSSCWIRVAQTGAGVRWGSVYLPRIGHEVIVDFIEGDPDQPIIIGAVYNATEMPPYKLPDEKTKTVIYKSNSSLTGEGFNEIRIEDKKGKEQIFVHAERDQDIRVKNDRREWIGHDRSLIVKNDKLEKVERDKHIVIGRHQVEKIESDMSLAVGGKVAIKIGGSKSEKVQGDVMEQFAKNHSEEVAQTLYLKGMQVIIEATTGITLKVGGSSISINSGGIQIVGTPMVTINSGGSPLSFSPKSLVPPASVLAAIVADDASPGALSQIQANQVAGAPTHDSKAEENKEKKHWIGLEMVDEEGKPVPGLGYKVKLPDGSETSGTTDEKGQAKITNIDPGSCQITWDLDKDAWEEA